MVLGSSSIVNSPSIFKSPNCKEILKLKERVKKLERKRKSSISYPRKRIYRHVEYSDDDLDEEDASEQGRKSDKTKSMFKDSDFHVLDDDMENVERETVNTATTRISDVSTPVTIAGVAISTAEPRTPPTTAITAFIDKDLTIAQTLVKMRSIKLKGKRDLLSRYLCGRNPRLTRLTINNFNLFNLWSNKTKVCYTHQQLKHKTLEELQKLYQKE
ncbi:hypothetical protein Tco_0398347 [Tanacetum coccineum]